MIVHQAPQQSTEWYELRLGIPTASEFSKIVTPKGQLSKQARDYAFRLIAEAILQETSESLNKLEWLSRGKELEPEAARLYEFQYDLTTQVVGLITNDEGTLGASLDRLVGADGCLEIKCPAAWTHVGYMVEDFGDEYKPQVQGQLLIAEREWCDRFSYHPRLPPHCHRTYRDEVFIKLLSKSLDAFLEMKAEMIAKVRAAGAIEANRRVKLAHEQELARAHDQTSMIMAG
jgi:YqaJ-like viral recombinase domain